MQYRISGRNENQAIEYADVEETQPDYTMEVKEK